MSSFFIGRVSLVLVLGLPVADFSSLLSCLPPESVKSSLRRMITTLLSLERTWIRCSLLEERKENRLLLRVRSCLPSSSTRVRPSTPSLTSLSSFWFLSGRLPSQMPASIASTRAVSRQPSAAGGDDEDDQPVAGPSGHRVEDEPPQADAAPRAKPGVSFIPLRLLMHLFFTR